MHTNFRKVDFRTKSVMRDKVRLHIIMKDSALQEDRAFPNRRAATNRAPAYTRQMLLKVKENLTHSTVIAGDINTSLW